MYNLEGKKEKNIIYFLDNEFSNEITIHKNKITVLRTSENVEYIIEYINNENTIFYYNIKEYNISLEIEIKTKSIVVKDNKIKVEYTQKIENEEQNYEYILEWEEVK